MPGVKGRSGGRNAKTTEQLERDGTFRPGRHAGIENPETPPGRPKPPIKLGKIARAEWKRMVARLEVSKVISRIDDAVLYQYCKLFEETEEMAARMKHVTERVALVEDVIPTLHGELILEAVKEMRAMTQQEGQYFTKIRSNRGLLRVYLVEFGLTPAARSRVKQIEKPSTPTAPTSPFARLQGQAQAFRRVK